MSEALTAAMQETAERIAKQARTAERDRTLHWVRSQLINKSVATEHTRGWNDAISHVANNLSLIND
jgi:hypothetical protein